MSKFEVRYIPVTLSEFRMDTSGDSVRMTGHAAVFNSFSEDLGGFKEIIRPTAFARSLSANPDVRFLVNHDDLPLARTRSKTLMLAEDQRGLHFQASMEKSDPDVQRLIPKVARGDLNQMSFGFRCLKDQWRTENGQDIRELHDCELDDGDVSIVSYPAYKAADVSMRGLDSVRKAHEEYRKGLHAAEVVAETNKVVVGMSVSLAERIISID